MTARIRVTRLSEEDMLANLLKFVVEVCRDDTSSCCTRFEEDLVIASGKCNMIAPLRLVPFASEAFGGSQCGLSPC